MGRTESGGVDSVWEDFLADWVGLADMDMGTGKGNTVMEKQARRGRWRPSSDEMGRVFGVVTAEVRPPDGLKMANK